MLFYHGMKTSASRKPTRQIPADKSRTRTAQRIHIYIMRASQALTKEQLKVNLENLLQIIEKCSVKTLLEGSEHGCTAFYDALIMPFKNQEDKKWAEEISTALWEVLFGTFEKRFPNRIRDILIKINDEGFSLLHAAVFTCDSNLERIILLLKKPENKEALQKNIKSRTVNGFLILAQAIISHCNTRVIKVGMLLQEPGNEAALYDNLYNVTNDGFMALSHATTSGRVEIFMYVLGLLQVKGYEDALQRNLNCRTKLGFVFLQHALLSENIEIINQAIALLRDPGNKAILLMNLNNRTNDGVVTLSHALTTRNSVVINAVMALYQMPGNEEALRFNLRHLSAFILLGAIAYKNKDNLKSVITVLKMDLNTARANILARNIDRNNCLSQAINTLDMEIILLIDDFILTVFGSESNKIKIDLMQDYDLKKAVYDDTPGMNGQIRGYIQSIQDKITQREFEKRNADYARAHPPQPRKRP